MYPATNQELARKFNISVSTVRRDLDSLAAEGIVRRTHGGAVRIRSRTNFEPSTDLARRTAVEEKNSIVRHTCKMIEPKQSIIIDSGAVIAHMLAEEIAANAIPLTVITNDLYVATTLGLQRTNQTHRAGRDLSLRLLRPAWRARSRVSR